MIYVFTSYASYNVVGGDMGIEVKDYTSLGLSFMKSRLIIFAINTLS